MLPLYPWLASPVMEPNLWPWLKEGPDLPASTFGVPWAASWEPLSQSLLFLCWDGSRVTLWTVWQPSTGAGEWKNKKNSVSVRDVDWGRVDINMRSNPKGVGGGGYTKSWKTLRNVGRIHTKLYLVSQKLQLINPADFEQIKNVGKNGKTNIYVGDFNLRCFPTFYLSIWTWWALLFFTSRVHHCTWKMQFVVGSLSDREAVEAD